MVTRRPADRVRHGRSGRAVVAGEREHVFVVDAGGPARRGESSSSSTACSRRGHHTERAGHRLLEQSRRPAQHLHGGGEWRGSRPVDEDAAIDWLPIWSPDGSRLFRERSRDVDECSGGLPSREGSGHARGTPEPVTSGVYAAASRPKPRGTARRLAFRSRLASVNPVAIPFDPQNAPREHARTIVNSSGTTSASPVTSRLRRETDLLLQHRQHQEDLFVGRSADPSGGVTDDARATVRRISWPDGKSLLFYSNREAGWGIWTIGVDGGGLRKVATTPTGAVYPIVSPNGNDIVYIDNCGRNAILIVIATARHRRERSPDQIERPYLSPPLVA